MIEFDGEFFNWHDEFGFKSPREFADFIAENVKMKEGFILYEKNYFELDGTLENGKTLFIAQGGEYDMYGGPYDPKMKEPDIKLDGKDFPLSIIEQIFEEEGWKIESGNFPDMSSTSVYGWIFSKKDSFVKGKHLGLI
jgi:hypothetical protein